MRTRACPAVPFVGQELLDKLNFGRERGLVVRIRYFESARSAEDAGIEELYGVKVNHGRKSIIIKSFVASDTILDRKQRILEMDVSTHPGLANVYIAIWILPLIMGAGAVVPQDAPVLKRCNTSDRLQSVADCSCSADIVRQSRTVRVIDELYFASDLGTRIPAHIRQLVPDNPLGAAVHVVVVLCKPHTLVTERKFVGPQFTFPPTRMAGALPRAFFNSKYHP